MERLEKLHFMKVSGVLFCICLAWIPPSHTYTSELLILVLPSSYGPSSRSNWVSSSPRQLPALEVMATCVALSAERKKSPLLLSFMARSFVPVGF